ncbi:hypothetical protein [Leisingera sp. ANG-M1]|uniref:hypothetical protein n=1 Tax=Leisingera sp. ANG-M1 TaxID=1577895 RepID=UPI001269D960|nr:hypothetical protein [Leisingera sp. ANG-M1]
MQTKAGADTLLEPPQAGYMICAQGYRDLGEQPYPPWFCTGGDLYLLQIQGGKLCRASRFVL